MHFPYLKYRRKKEILNSPYGYIGGKGFMDIILLFSSTLTRLVFASLERARQ